MNDYCGVALSCLLVLARVAFSASLFAFSSSLAFTITAYELVRPTFKNTALFFAFFRPIICSICRMFYRRASHRAISWHLSNLSTHGLYTKDPPLPTPLYPHEPLQERRYQPFRCAAKIFSKCRRISKIGPHFTNKTQKTNEFKYFRCDIGSVKGGFSGVTLKICCDKPLV